MFLQISQNFSEVEHMGTTNSSKLQSKNGVLKNVLFYVVPFVLLSAYLLVNYFTKGKPEINGYYMIHFLYTYDHGFISRGFIGEVISWFTNNVSDELMSSLLVWFYAFFVFTASLCIGKALNKASEDKETFYPVLALIIVLCLLPTTFRLYYEDMRLDKLTWAVALLATFFACNKKTIFLAVPLCILATLINPLFLFTSMILVSIILLQEFKSSNLSKKNGIICLVAYASMIALGIWAVVSEKMLTFENATEMVNTYYARYSGTQEIDYENFENLWLVDFFATPKEIINIIIYKYGLAWRGFFDAGVTLLLVFIPLFTLLGIFWKKAAKHTDDKFQKFIFFLCMISPVATLPAIFLSWESQKLFGNNLVVQLCLIVYYIASNNTSVKLALKDVLNFAKKNTIVCAVFVMYCLAVFA